MADWCSFGCGIWNDWNCRRSRLSARRTNVAPSPSNYITTAGHDHPRSYAEDRVEPRAASPCWWRHRPVCGSEDVDCELVVRIWHRLLTSPTLQHIHRQTDSDRQLWTMCSRCTHLASSDWQCSSVPVILLHLSRWRAVSIETPIIHLRPTDSAILQPLYCRQTGLSSLHRQSLEQSPCTSHISTDAHGFLAAS